MTELQKAAIARFYIEMAEAIATADPSLDPTDVQVQDMDKAVVYGVRLAVELCFGREEEETLYGACIADVAERLGYTPDLRASIVKSGAAGDSESRLRYNPRDWKPPI